MLPGEHADGRAVSEPVQYFPADRVDEQSVVRVGKPGGWRDREWCYGTNGTYGTYGSNRGHRCIFGIGSYRGGHVCGRTRRGGGNYGAKIHSWRGWTLHRWQYHPYRKRGIHSWISRVSSPGFRIKLTAPSSRGPGFDRAER